MNNLLKRIRSFFCAEHSADLKEIIQGNWETYQVMRQIGDFRSLALADLAKISTKIPPQRREFFLEYNRQICGFNTALADYRQLTDIYFKEINNRSRDLARILEEKREKVKMALSQLNGIIDKSKKEIESL